MIETGNLKDLHSELKRVIDLEVENIKCVSVDSRRAKSNLDLQRR